MRSFFKMFQNMKDKAFSAGQNFGYQKAEEDQQKNRERFQQVEMDMLLGAPLIIAPNEWCNPVVGFGKSIQMVGNSPMLIVENYLSDTVTDTWCGGVKMSFSDQRLDIALSLDPYQLWAITAHNAHGYGDFDKPKSGVRWDKEKCMEVLKDNGFFERWNAFKKDNNL